MKEDRVTRPPRAVLAGERFDLIAGRFLSPGELSGGSVRILANRDQLCANCSNLIEKGEEIDADLVHLHVICSEMHLDFHDAPESHLTVRALFKHDTTWARALEQWQRFRSGGHTDVEELLDCLITSHVGSECLKLAKHVGRVRNMKCETNVITTIQMSAVEQMVVWYYG